MNRIDLGGLKGPAAFVFALLLAACAGNPPGEGSAQQASQYQPVEPIVTGAARSRAQAHVDLGMAYLTSGNFAVALEEARLALNSDPNYALGYNLLALAHMSLGETREAQGYFERASQLGPNDPDIANNHGWFLCLNGREREGLERLRLAQRNPLYRTPARAYINAGLCALKLSDDVAAEAAFNRAVSLDPGSAQSYFHLAGIAYRKNELVRARQFIEQLLKVDAASPETLWLALRIERKIGDRQAENYYAGQLRRDFPRSAEFRFLQEGQYD